MTGPLVVAHRGASEEHPEHTLIAYERAIEVGADALECDVRLTSDGHLVCVHDPRLDRTSNGAARVSTSTLEELRQWDYGAWKSGAEPAPPGEVHPHHELLTLERLLELVVSSRRPVGLSIETKHPSRHSLQLEGALVEALRRFGLVPTGERPADPQAPGSVRVMSFSVRALERMRRLAPSVPTAFLTARVPARFHDGRLPHGAVVAAPWVGCLHQDPDYVARVHARGGRVHVWTVDDRADIELCRELGVDAIISNRPAAVLLRLGR